MTDDDRLTDPLAAAMALPRGSLVIIRTRDARARITLARAIIAQARSHPLFVLVADDPDLAARLGADGIHLPERRAREAAHWRSRHPSWLITAASHGHTPAPPAADAILLSPVFATQSHIGAPSLGAARASFIAARQAKPVYALGGIDARNATLLSRVFCGIAAIGALAA
ncbi:MAG TPA: thiamine phosphate synthase [Rhizomicrobium sp.]|nr:thiamine phosphate synthase [Rhizomicrobium sp.]